MTDAAPVSVPLCHASHRYIVKRCALDDPVYDGVERAKAVSALASIREHPDDGYHFGIATVRVGQEPPDYCLREEEALRREVAHIPVPVSDRGVAYLGFSEV